MLRSTPFALCAAAGAALLFSAGAAQAQFRDLFQSLADGAEAGLGAGLAEALGQPAEQQQQYEQYQQAPLVAPGQQVMSLHGYSAGFAPVRQEMNAGRYDQARTLYLDGGNAGLAGAYISSDDTFLTNVEQGVMMLDAGDYASAMQAFNLAEDNVEETKEDERDGGLLGGLGAMVGGVSKAVTSAIGVRGLAAYSEEDYERVLQLNYLTLAYMLSGQDGAFNVGRRGAMEQALLRDRFLERLAEAEAQPQEGGVAANAGAQAGFYTQFEQFSSIAARVPNAYVNPLGDYITGLVFEIDATANPETLANANSAYVDALALVPSSVVLQEAVRATGGDAAEDRRLVHVVVGEGFSPTRQLMAYGLQLSDTETTTLEIPVLAPIASQIERFEIHVPGGPMIAVADPIADLEAIMLRSQQDSLPMRWAEIAVGALRTTVQRDAIGNSQMGALVLGAVEGLQAPDMRSWSSLPRRFHVARVEIPVGLAEIEIRALDGNGQALSVQRVPISAESRHTVIYGRATDASLTLYRPEHLGLGAAL